jgi:Tfp pilus assembly protein PilN
MRVVKVVALIVFFFFCMIFFVQNTAMLSTPLILKMDVFSISYTSPEVPFYVVLLLAFVVGGLFSLAYFILERVRLGAKVKEQAGRIAALEKELAASKSYSGLSTGYASPSYASPVETASDVGPAAPAGEESSETPAADQEKARDQ